jgi:antitoxin MazE
MKTNIINIGNSQGVILPAAILKKLHINSRSEVEIMADNEVIIIKPRPRREWAETFAAETKNSPPENDMFEEVGNDFDNEEWEW